ncbi:hypothetical protein D3C72_1978880 [compost metagenome]
MHRIAPWQLSGLGAARAGLPQAFGHMGLLGGMCRHKTGRIEVKAQPRLDDGAAQRRVLRIG